MRKINLTATTLFLTIISTSICAQSNKFNVGIEGGTGISNTRGFWDSGIGYAGGLFCQYDLSKIFSAHVGFGYEQKGSKYDINAADSTGEVQYYASIKQNYEFLTMPVLIRANFGSKINYFVNAGPYFSYLLKQSSKVDDSNNNSTYETDNTSDFKRFETGFSFGVGLSFSIIERLSLSFEIRNNLGLTNLSKTEGATAKTNSAHLLAGLSYRLGE